MLGLVLVSQGEGAIGVLGEGVEGARRRGVAPLPIFGEAVQSPVLILDHDGARGLLSSGDGVGVGPTVAEGTLLGIGRVVRALNAGIQSQTGDGQVGVLVGVIAKDDADGLSDRGRPGSR